MISTGLSRSTVADARERFGRAVMHSRADGPEFIAFLNEVLEQLFVETSWHGRTGIFAVAPDADDIITLPYWLECVYGAQVDNVLRHLKPMEWEFLAHGPGDQDNWNNAWLRDLGEVAIQTTFPDDAQTVSVTSSQTEEDVSIRIYGEDSNGDVIRDANGVPGEILRLQNTTTATSSGTFSDITGIRKPITKGSITVKAVTDDTTLSVIDPGVKIPLYRRYQVHLSNVTEVRMLCGRRYVPVANDEDFLMPGNLRALHRAATALDFEHKSDVEQSQQFWALAIDTLNKEVEAHQGGLHHLPINWEPHGPGVDPVETTC